MLVSKGFEVVWSLISKQRLGEKVSIMKAKPFIYGEVYTYDLSSHLENSDSYTLEDSDLPEGVSVDVQQGLVEGTPVQHPKRTGPFFIHLKNSTNTSDEIIHFAVKANPRDLWKNIEPDLTKPFPKTHTDRSGFENELVKVIAASRRGRDHEHRGEFREDDFRIEFDEELQMLFVAVSDGMGAYERSREASRIQCEESIVSLTESLRKGTTQSGDLLRECILDGFAKYLNEEAALDAIQPYVTQVMTNAALASYRKLVEAAKNEGVPLKGGPKNSSGKKEGFAATLLLAVIFRHQGQWCTFTFATGDGILVALDGPEVSLLMTPDKGEDHNETLPLSHIQWNSPTIVEELTARTFIHTSPDMSHIMVMTDGVSNGKLQTGSEHLDPGDWKNFCEEVLEYFDLSNMDVAAEKLEEWLHFYVKGTHDDRTLVMCELQVDDSVSNEPAIDQRGRADGDQPEETEEDDKNQNDQGNEDPGDSSTIELTNGMEVDEDDSVDDVADVEDSENEREGHSCHDPINKL